VLGFTDEQIADFVGGFFEEGRQFGDDQLYSIPLSKSTEVLYYNKTFFDQHGLTVPTTWEELETVCAQIKAIDPSCVPLGYDYESNWFITMCAQLGSDYTSATGEHFIFDNEENYAFVEMLRRWYEKGYVTTQELNGGKYTSELFTATTGTKSYMSIGSSAGATHQRPRKDANGNYLFEVGVAPIPQVDASNPKAILQGPSLCIFNSENPNEIVASWLFVKFLATNIDFQAKFSMVSGYMPVIKSVTESKLYSDFLAKADGGDYISALVAKVCLEEYSAFITTPAFVGSSTARAQVGILIQNCFIQKPAAGEDVKAMIKRLFQNAIDECEYKLGQ
jgi:multiple sugar transport system substrate-binding protein